MIKPRRWWVTVQREGLVGEGQRRRIVSHGFVRESNRQREDNSGD